MGIHVHVKGQPDLCGCCAVKEKLDTLWDRASGAVLTINGVYPDAMGAITVDLLQEAAVQSLIEDYINPMQDNLDAMNTRLDGYTDIFDNYGAILQAVNVTIPGEIDDVQDYAEAIADDLLQNYLTKQAIISGYATKAEIQGLATRQDIQNVINGYVFKQGTATPQVISGSGGLQIAGDLAVGGDFTVSSDTFIHWDNIAGGEIGPITISGTSINIPGYVTLDTPQIITGHKTFNDVACTTPPTGAPSEAVVNKAYVESTDGVTNNLLHRSSREFATGQKVLSNGSWCGVLGMNIRTTGISKREVCDVQVGTPAEGATNNTFVHFIYMGRYSTCIGTLHWGIDSNRNITNVSITRTSYTTEDRFTYFYIYPSVHRVGYFTIAIGNNSATNNHYSLNILGAYGGAGININLLFDHMEEYVTQETIATATEIRMVEE